MLTYSADQTPPYPQQRKQNTSSGLLVIDGSQREYIVQNGLPYADNQVTVYAFNIKLGVQGPSEMATHRSLAIGEFDIGHEQNTHIIYIYISHTICFCFLRTCCSD